MVGRKTRKFREGGSEDDIGRREDESAGRWRDAAAACSQRREPACPRTTTCRSKYICVYQSQHLQDHRNCDDGSKVKFRLLYPAAIPQVFFDEHAEHLAVDFRTSIASALERQQRLVDGRRNLRDMASTIAQFSKPAEQLKHQNNRNSHMTTPLESFGKM